MLGREGPSSAGWLGAELERVSSPALLPAWRAGRSDFLNHVVEESFAGRAGDRLKGYTIGGLRSLRDRNLAEEVSMTQKRPAGCVPCRGAGTVSAGRRYYASEGGSGNSMRIGLPRGGYAGEQNSRLHPRRRGPRGRVSARDYNRDRRSRGGLPVRRRRFRGRARGPRW